MADNEIEILQLRFDGNGINPDRVKPSEISDLIKDYQDALLFTIKQDYPAIDTEQILFTLESIRNESLGINFKAIKEPILPQIRDAVVASYLLITSSINTNDYSSLNQNTIQSLKRIVAFSKKHGCNAEFNRNGETISIITPNADIQVNKIPLIKSNTIIYGEIVDVGSNIHLKLNEGYNIIIDADKKTSKALASRLWEQVGFRGTAKWDPVTFKIVEFKLVDVLDYNPGGLQSAFAKLRDVSGAWDQFNSNDDINKQLLRD